MENKLELARKLLWGLAAISVAACMVRNDYNVMFAFLVIIILINNYKDNPRFYSKLIIHLMAALIVIDIFWLVIIMPYWNAKIDNKYWNSLGGVHSFALFMAFIEICIKGGILGLFFLDYKEKNDDISDLMKLQYEMEQEKLKGGPLDNASSNNLNSKDQLNGNLSPNPNREIII